MINDIAAAIITKDAAVTIAETLDSLREFPEVLVYDNGSSDETLDIVRRYPNTRIETGEFFGFGTTFNIAADLATHDWVFTIDADESISPELLANIKAADLSDVGRAYAVDRHNFIMGKRVRFAGWGGDWLTRLYHRKHFRHNDAKVHPKIFPVDDGKVIKLKGPLRHEAILGLGDFLIKTDRYTEMSRYTRKTSLPAFVILLKACWSFFRSFVLQGGFMDGWRGLVVAYATANGTFFKHIKVYADKKTGNRYRKSEAD